VIWQTFFPPGGNTFTFTGLAPGTHAITMADDADFSAGPPDDPGACLTTIYVTVPSTGGPSISISQINPSCASNTGSITATGSFGTLPYTYNIDGGPYSAINVFNNLAPGVHAVNVKDGTGCTNGANVILPGQSVPTVTAVIQNTSCNSDNGTITATGSGGTAPLEYSINGTIFQASNIFSNLATGSYTLYVKDANACFSSIPVSVLSIGIPAVTAYTIAASCNNSDGSIVATGTSGTAPYTYSINGTVYQSSNTFSGLAAGFYTIYLKDDRGCIITTGVTVGNIGAPVFTAAIVAAKCGNPSGSITVTASGGTPAYEYSSDGGVTFQTSNILAALTPGNHVVIVKDANGCIASQTIFVPNINGPQTLTAVIVNAACGNANGSITATGTGGTGALQYSINGTTYQASNIFNGLAANTYTLYVRDVNLCVKTLPVTVLNLPAPALTATTSPASCGLSDGTITAIATGGTLPLAYSRNGITFQASNIFLNLAAGPYTITVRDARNCVITFDITVVTAGSSVTPTFNPVGPICAGAVLAPLPTTSLNGIIGTWAPALNNTTTTTYTFTPNAGQCATTATLTITVNPNVTPTFNAVAPICSGATLNPLPTTSLNGITGTWAPALNNTTTTLYTFTPTAGQCATTTTLTITVNPILSPTINCGVSTTSSVTFNWAAVAGATGYTISYQINANPVVPVGPIGNLLTYSVTGLNGGDNVTITVTPTGGVGTCFTSANATCIATACTPPTANISYAGPFCVNITAPQLVTLTGTGTFTGGTYSSAPAGLSINATTGAITPNTSTPATYTVTYTVAASGGCPGVTATASVTINPKPAPILIYHN
jgi:hypothetical protein